MTEKTVNKAPRGRPTRQPVGFRNRLAAFDKDPAYEYRWVNNNADGGDRVKIMEDAGYEFAPKSEQRSGRVEAGPLGSAETVPGGNGDTMVLMRIKKEWYEEDQKAKQDRVDELDRAQKRTPDGLYGKITYEHEKK